MLGTRSCAASCDALSELTGCQIVFREMMSETVDNDSVGYENVASSRKPTSRSNMHDPGDSERQVQHTQGPSASRSEHNVRSPPGKSQNLRTSARTMAAPASRVRPTSHPA
eukprot:4157904-Prymnesium_polylepis.1